MEYGFLLWKSHFLKSSFISSLGLSARLLHTPSGCHILWHYNWVRKTKVGGKKKALDVFTFLNKSSAFYFLRVKGIAHFFFCLMELKHVFLMHFLSCEKHPGLGFCFHVAITKDCSTFLVCTQKSGLLSALCGILVGSTCLYVVRVF